jgi:murein DD-endopeptidase MepM/ murein hydrolase activator NlpD
LAKKTLFIKLFVGAAPVTFLLLPLVVQASVFSFLTTLFERGANTTIASTLNLNSQTMPLLEPAVNLNPNPPKGGGNITVTDGVALVPIESPTGEAVDIEEIPSSSQISVYTVREGDTLTQIAEMFDVTVNTIIWANDIKGRVIKPGDLLVILPVTGIRHTVAKGDTLETVAKKYKGDAEEIALYNEIETDDALAVGTTVIIPSGVLSAPTTPARASSSSTARTVPLQGAGGPAYDGFYLWPVNGGTKTQGIHGYNGIDIGAKAGTEIYAAASGVVLVARNNGGWNGGYGNYVVVQHNNGTQTLYAHATTVLVAPGDTVSQGQTIATVGRTGQSTGNHLHFEVRGAKNPF